MWGGSSRVGECAIFDVRGIKGLTPPHGLHRRLEQDGLLDLEDPALVLLHDFQRLVDDCIYPGQNCLPGTK